jgi:hypothetical protein
MHIPRSITSTGSSKSLSRADKTTYKVNQLIIIIS